MGDRMLTDNQRRAARIALANLDRELCVIESWADGREDDGVLYRERNDLTRRRIAALRKRIAEARELLVEARDRFGLRVTEARASGDAWGRCCALRDTLSELDAKHMKGYGELSTQGAEYLDGLSSRLVAAVDRMARTLRREAP